MLAAEYQGMCKFYYMVGNYNVGHLTYNRRLKFARIQVGYMFFDNCSVKRRIYRYSVLEVKPMYFLSDNTRR